MAVDGKDATFQEIMVMGKHSSDGVFIYHMEEKRLLYSNPAITKILEMNKKLLMEEPSLILRSIPQADHEYLDIRFSELRQRRVVEDVPIHLRANRMEKFLLCSAFVCAEKSVIFGFVKDVTNRRKHEEYLVNFGARKDAILDMVSQNLSTPLNLSKFTVDLIEKAVHEKKYHKLAAHVSVMREVTADCIRIIDDFLQEEHLASPKIDPTQNRFDVIQKIMVVLERLKISTPDKQFKLKSEQKHLFIEADDLKFFQIVHNLLSNAIKFTESKGTIEVVVKDYNNAIEVVVKDNGIGIPDALKPFLFEKKTRAGRPGLKGEISNGIGLYVVKELTRMLGGTISFESKVNKGTKFTLELPKG